ncbi:MAG: beta-aspartyl-peptidase [Polaribacter sp.]|uniref:beta-aspartyl-peptidase n=1 Tax=Polaribacter sp. TaxID=1920175 RepID=UPI003BAEE0FA
MLTLIKNTQLYSPKKLGKKDILIADKKIVAIGNNLDSFKNEHVLVIDAKEKIVTPGLIDQHIHINGAGGKQGFASMTPEISLSELIACGSTTVVGLLGTDGTARDIKSLYAKAKALEQEGISAYMFCGYYGVDSLTITKSIQDDMVFIDKVLGCKIAISDVRSSYPTAKELLRKLRDVRVGGFLSQKKGILHVHLGGLESKLDPLFELVEKYKFPIEHISPTHLGRTKALFDEGIKFAKMGGIIDITTGASQYTAPYKSVLYALEQGASIENMTFSSDGNAGLTKFDENKNEIGVRKAPIDKNLEETILLIQKGGLAIEEAFKLITTNPARNLGLQHKGKVEVGCDADLCFFDNNFKLTDVFANGKQLMRDAEIIVKGTFES